MERHRLIPVNFAWSLGYMQIGQLTADPVGPIEQAIVEIQLAYIVEPIFQLVLII